MQIWVKVNPPVTGQGWIGSPLSGSSLTGIVPVTVTSGVTLQSGTLTLFSVSNATSIVLNANTTGSGQIGSIDTTTLANGTYYLQLNATNSSGTTMGSGLWLTVTGDYKPGRVTTTITDVVVPAPGLPIRIDRTYDSLNRNSSSDFGYGWSLGINVQLEISPTYDVTLTLNGQRRTFYFTPTLPSFLNFFYSPAYKAEPGFYGTLTAANSSCGSLMLKVASTYVCYGDGAPFSVNQFIYTDPYGRVYTMGADGSLQSIRDVAGNTLTVTPTGITSSNGLSVTFQRDSEGRITKITLPPANPGDQPNVYLYTYNSAGNLESVTYPGISTAARYQYDTVDTHLYKSGTDMRGNALPLTEYYTDGRLKNVTDARGKTTS